MEKNISIEKSSYSVPQNGEFTTTIIYINSEKAVSFSDNNGIYFHDIFEENESILETSPIYQRMLQAQEEYLRAREEDFAENESSSLTAQGFFDHG